ILTRHAALAFERRTFVDADARRLNHALDLCRAVQLESIAGVDLSAHHAVDYDRRSEHVGLQVGAFADDDHAGSRHLALDVALELHLTVELESTFDVGAG